MAAPFPPTGPMDCTTTGRFGDHLCIHPSQKACTVAPLLDASVLWVVWCYVVLRAVQCVACSIYYSEKGTFFLVHVCNLRHCVCTLVSHGHGHISKWRAAGIYALPTTQGLGIGGFEQMDALCA